MAQNSFQHFQHLFDVIKTLYQLMLKGVLSLLK